MQPLGSTPDLFNSQISSDNSASDMPKSFVANQSYYFNASVEVVFQSLTEPKQLTKWFLSRAKLDQKRGGAFSFDWIGGYHMTSKLRQFEPNKAVSFSWIDKLKNGRVANTTATFKVARKGKGTLLTLRHTGFKDPEHFADCSSRWGYYLTNLKSVLDHNTDLRSKYDW